MLLYCEKHSIIRLKIRFDYSEASQEEVQKHISKTERNHQICSKTNQKKRRRKSLLNSLLTQRISLSLLSKTLSLYMFSQLSIRLIIIFKTVSSWIQKQMLMSLISKISSTISFQLDLAIAYTSAMRLYL